jgi:hypothetical protein
MPDWKQLAGWTLLYALVFWGVSTANALFEKQWRAWGLDGLAQALQVFVPLLAAFLIGVRVQTWWWVAGPPVAIVLIQLTYPLTGFLTASPESRREMGTGLILAAVGVGVQALFAGLAAGLGVLIAGVRAGR